MALKLAALEQRDCYQKSSNLVEERTEAAMSGAVAGGTGAVVVQLVEEYWETDVLVVQVVTTEALAVVEVVVQKEAAVQRRRTSPMQCKEIHPLRCSLLPPVCAACAKRSLRFP